MMDNLYTYSFANSTNLCDFGTCADVSTEALTTGTLDPQANENSDITRDGGYTPPPTSVVYTPQEIDGGDSLIFDSYLSEASTVSIDLSSTSTCVNVATGYDLFNFGYQLLIREHGRILNRVDSFKYNNTLNIVCSASLISNWEVLSGTATYNKILSSASIDRLPVGSYRNTDWPYDIITVNYYSPTDYIVPPPFWTGDLLNVYTTKKIVWDMFSTRIGGEELKNTYIYEKRDQSAYIVDLPRNLLLYDQKEILTLTPELSLSAIQLGNTLRDIDIAITHNFGKDVDTNDDGTRIIVGVPYYKANVIGEGLVRVYQLANSTWVKIGQDLVGVDPSDYFGWSVSMNGDGNRIAVGYYSANPGERGATKIYELSGAQWVQMGQTIAGVNVNDYSGTDVQLNTIGNRVAIVERYGDEGGYESGQVRVYEYDGSIWQQMGQILPGLATLDGVFNVAINSIGDVIVYSSPGSDVMGPNTGAVRAYKWDGVQWNQMGQDVYGDSEHFLLGYYCLSLNGAGDIFAAGAVGNSGSVLVYKYNGALWELLGDLPAPEINGYIAYGYSVTLNFAGDRIAIGHPLRYINSRGNVEVYEFNGENWEKIIVDIQGPINQTAGQSTWFGASVAFNKNGDRLTVGAPLISGGEVRSYQLPQYPLVGLSSYNAYKSEMLWSDGVVTENPFIYPFYLPDGTYGSSAGTINFRKFTNSGEYTILSNTFYYRNSTGKEKILTEPYNITFVIE